jgi:uncharacterized membrane protein YhaH (DUF805 family)
MSSYDSISLVAPSGRIVAPSGRTNISNDIFPPVFEIFSSGSRVGRLGYLNYNVANFTAIIIGMLVVQGVNEFGVSHILTIATPLVYKFGSRSLNKVFDLFKWRDELEFVIIACGVVLMIVTNLAIGARRCHDIGRSGFFQLFLCIPYIGWLFTLYLLAVPGDEGPNKFGEPPTRYASVSRLKQLPQHLWRGEVNLANTFWIYVLVINFLLLDKAVSAFTAGYELENLNLAYVGFLLLANGFFAIALWRSADFYKGRRIWRVLSKAVSVFMVGRVLLTIYAVSVSGF